MKKFIEKLIERLEERSKEYNSGVRLHGKPEEMLTYEAIEIVNELAEEYNNGWIPVSQPPKLAVIEGGITEVVLIQHEDGRINIGTYIDNSFYSLNIDNGMAYMAEDNSVVYWRLFPTPYQPEHNSEIPNNYQQQIMNRFERVE